jgi:SAM-dependent methyltransferase
MSFYTEFAPFYNQIFPFREEVYGFLREYAGSSGDCVLDAGCGPGFYCGRFSRDGFSAAGVDLDSGMISAAKEAFPQAGFHCMDISEISSLRGSFQLIYSIGNVLAHLSPERLPHFLASVYDSLSAGGCWVFQVVNWDYLLTLKEYAFPVKRIESGAVEFHRRYPVISPERVIFEVEMISDGKTLFHEQSTIYAQNRDTCLQLHETAGFLLEGVYGGFDRSEFFSNRNSGMVMVFKKAVRSSS